MTSVRPSRLLLWSPLLAALVALPVISLVGCTEDPEPPAWDSPFDPANPAAADPFGLTAAFDADRVVLTWNQLEGYGIATYEVQKSLDGLNFSTLGDTTAGSGEMVYVVADVTPTATNFFRIRAVDADGQAPRMSHVTPATVDAGPLLAVLGPDPVLTRSVDLQAVTTSGDSVHLASDALFTAPRSAPIETGGTATFADVDLGPADGPDTTFVLYARAVTVLGDDLPPAYSQISSLELGVGLAPAIGLAGGGGAIASPWPDIALADSARGIARVRFATVAEDLADAPWQEAAPVLAGIPVQDTVQPQTLFAELETEFGYTASSALELAADDLTAADFSLDLPGNRISATRQLTLLHDAVATEMRVSQDPGFGDAPWVDYADTSGHVLAGEPGLHQVYAQYRNHWHQSPVRADYVILSGAELEVQFTNPTAGLPVRGGRTIEVTGTASTFDADYAITAVRVHLGDGWVEASGAENWEILWDVPLLDADTAWSLGAEVTAANADSSDIRTGLAWIEVTISQLAVTIASPAAETELPRGQQATISGTATPYLAGAPLDSVVVTALDQRLPVDGALTEWSVVWDVPAEGATPLPTDLEAWAHAGGDSVRARVPVVLVAPPQESNRVTITPPRRSTRAR